MSTTFFETSTRSQVRPTVRHEVRSLPQATPREVEKELRGYSAKPEWSALDVRGNSNTFGAGRAMAPSRARVRRQERIVEPSPVVFDNSRGTVLRRWARNAQRVAQSRGGVTIAAGSIVLSLGLSPLFMGEEPTVPAPAQSIEMSSVSSSAH